MDLPSLSLVAQQEQAIDELLPDIPGEDPLISTTQVPLENDFCDLGVTEDLYQPDPYRASIRVKRTNTAAIRFRQSSHDMITLLEGTDQEQEQYLWGLVLSGLIIFCGFLAYSIIICILREVDYERVGFVSGRFVRPSPPKRKQKQASLVTSQNVEAPSEEVLNDENGDSPVEIAASARNDGQITEQKSQSTCEMTDPNNTGASAMSMEVSTAQSNDVKDANAIQETVLDKTDDDTSDDPTNDKNQNGSNNEVNEVQEEDDDKEYKEAYGKWEKFCQRQEIRLFRTRITLAVIVLAIIVLCVLFCAYGDKYIDRSLDDVRLGLEGIQLRSQQGVDLINLFLGRENFFVNKTLNELEEIHGIFCPTITGINGSFCESLNPVQNCNFSGLPDEIQQDIEDLHTSVLLVLEEFVDFLKEFRTDLRETDEDLEVVLSNNNSLEWAFWVSFGFALVLGVVCLLILYGVVSTHINFHGPMVDWVRQQLLFPAFAACVALAACFSSAFFVAAVGASDFCINTPNTKVTWLLDDEKDSVNSAVYELAKFYANECSESFTPTRLRRQIGAVVAALRYLDQLSVKILAINPQEWKDLCGSDFEILETMVSWMQNQICIGGLTAEDLNQFLLCRNWFPVYEAFLYDALCFNGQEGMAWVAGSMTGIVFLSFFVLLFRAAAFDSEEEADYDPPKRLHGCYSRVGTLMSGCIGACHSPCKKNEDQALILHDCKTAAEIDEIVVEA
uniref:Uncharacterized protein n=1 Tax=Entomoneis paludosa TaxID=265537 RepID=A0A7S2Y2X1_9STRA|mmetsp:Transcript_12911/g.26793  ORF Transcript_12911/g.26793 Transcript_12911/m.26793 type:complete len:732 (+) Transcript_12911:46-2241(+)